MEEGHLLKHALVLLAHQTHHVHQVHAAAATAAPTPLRFSAAQRAPFRLARALPSTQATHAPPLLIAHQVPASAVVVALHQH